VLRVERLINEDSFMVHAGDTSIMPSRGLFSRLTGVHERQKAHATITVKEISDATIRQYGVADALETGEEALLVRDVVEKPERPTRNSP
jgi:UTP-glucose-1-phosphate uridylyltransferase